MKHYLNVLKEFSFIIEEKNDFVLGKKRIFQDGKMKNDFENNENIKSKKIAKIFEDLINNQKELHVEILKKEENVQKIDIEIMKPLPLEDNLITVFCDKILDGPQQNVFLSTEETDPTSILKYLSDFNQNNFVQTNQKNQDSDFDITLSFDETAN